MKHKLSACILIPTLAVLYPAEVGIKMHALGSCFISAACFMAFIAVLTNAENLNFFPTLVISFFQYNFK